MEQPCPQCGQYVADTEEFCPNPSCGAYLGWDRREAASTAPAERQPRSVPDRAAAPAADSTTGRPYEPPRDGPGPRTSHVASLSTERLEVAPGETADLTVTVTNTGSLVDEVRVSVASPLAAWTTVTPSAVQVYPGAQATAHVTVSPPHDDGPWAGPHPLVLDLASTRSSGAEQHSQHQVTVVVGARVGMTARLVPTVTSGRGTRFRSDVEVANHGNTPMHVSLQPRDDYGRLRWGRQTAAVTVPPGSAGSIPLTTRSRTNWWGDPDPLPFEVNVRGAPEVADQDDWEQRLEGRRDQQAVLSGWRIWALLAAVVAVVLLVAAPVGLALLDDSGDVQVEPDDSGQVTLPDLVGSEVGQATSELEEAGLQVSIVQEFSAEDAGTVLAQDPGAETTVDPGTTVNLLVSQGESPDAAVCDAVAEAREVLGEQGLTDESAEAARDVVDAAAVDGVDGNLVSLAGSASGALDAQDAAALGSALDQMAAICGQ